MVYQSVVGFELSYTYMYTSSAGPPKIASSRQYLISSLGIPSMWLCMLSNSCVSSTGAREGAAAEPSELEEGAKEIW